MSRKTRKHIRPMSLVMSIAIIGALAAFLVLANNPGATMAHGDVDDHAAACAAMTDEERRVHNAAAILESEEVCGAAGVNGDTDVPAIPGFVIQHGGEAQQVSVNWDAVTDAHEYIVEYRLCRAEPCGGDFTTTVVAPPTTSAVITGLTAGVQYQVQLTVKNTAGTVLARSSSLVAASRYLLTFDLRQFGIPNRNDDQNIVIPETPGATVTLRATVWVPDPIASSDETDTVAVRFMSDPADVTVTTANLLAVSENSIDDGELTIRPRDGDKRSFQISFDCVQDPTVLTVSIYDDDVRRVERGTITINCGEPEPGPGPGRTDESDAFSVVSYGDWEYDDVTDGFILDVSNGNPHLVNAHPHIESGLLSRDEPVVHELYTLGVSDKEMLKNLDNGSPRRAKEDPDNLLTRQEKNAYVEEGQRTVEVLTGQPNVQLTVTSMKSGPVYIRFLDSDMQPFGTDVDEESMWRGADVVGLDSQGRLELNNQEMELSKALALAYDQYNIVTPGAIPGQRADNSYLSGKDGTYNQGAFRFMNPCPAVGHHFYVEVYESEGKYLQTTEKVVCVPSPKPGPAGLVFEIDSQKPGEGVLRFEPARNAVSHTVLLIDASNRNIVEAVEDAVSPMMFNEELNNGWTYHIVVIAAGVNDQYTADAVLDYGVSWLDEADVPLSTDPSVDPTRMHTLCQVDNADITALLADCDADPVTSAMLSAPSGLMPSDATTDPGTLLVKVDWTPGAGAVGHLVMLFTSDWQGTPLVEGTPTGNSHTFSVDAGSYIAVVVAYDADGIQLAISGVTTVGGG